MNTYLVQKGEYKSSHLVSAVSPEDAVKEAFNGLSWGNDYDYEVLVFPIGEGSKFKVDRTLKVKEIK